MNDIILFQFVQNTTDYEDNIAVIAPELSEMIKEIEKKVGAFKVLQLDQQLKVLQLDQQQQICFSDL